MCLWHSRPFIIKVKQQPLCLFIVRFSQIEIMRRQWSHKSLVKETLPCIHLIKTTFSHNNKYISFSTIRNSYKVIYKLFEIRRLKNVTSFHKMQNTGIDKKDIDWNVPKDALTDSSFRLCDASIQVYCYFSCCSFVFLFRRIFTI